MPGETSPSADHETVDWSLAADQLTGELLLPGSADYETSHKPAIERFRHIRPAAVLRCRTPADVAQALAFAGRADLPMAVRSGGHDFAGRSSTTGLLIDLGPINGLYVSGSRVVVGPGVQLGALYRALDTHGRTVPGGSGPTVGIGGHTLGGGFGLLGRRYGLIGDSLVTAQVVLADGRIVHSDEERHSDLFWLLRGAGAAQAGVVTELVFDTIPAPTCTVFALTWDHRYAAPLVAAWQDWAPDAPDALAASLLLSTGPDPRQEPQLTVIGTAADIAEDDTRQLLKTLIATVGAGPRTTHLQSMTWRDTRRWLSRQFPADDHGGHSYSRSGFFRQPLPSEAVAELVDTITADRIPGEARELDFSPWAGAYNRVPVDATAFPHRRERFLLKHTATIAPSASPVVPSSWLARSWQAASPWGSGGVYPNFPDPDLDHPAGAYFGPNLDRIDQVRDAYDPGGLFGPQFQVTGRRASGQHAAS